MKSKEFLKENYDHNEYHDEADGCFNCIESDPAPTDLSIHIG
jgi:hypothetical protein